MSVASDMTRARDNDERAPSAGRSDDRTRVTYPAPSTDALGKIITFCGGAGSRTLDTQTRNP